jgi:N-succinyldiaminopimelate aminotransferase
LAHEAGVVAIPLTTSVSTAGVGDHLLRFAFCKSEKAIAEASLRLRQYALEGGLLDRSG